MPFGLMFYLMHLHLYILSVPYVSKCLLLLQYVLMWGTMSLNPDSFEMSSVLPGPEWIRWQGLNVFAQAAQK